MLPDTYLFNPTCEPAIASGSAYYTPPARLRKLEADLGYLPGWLGEEHDQVLLQGTVDTAFELKMRQLGFRLPEFLNLKQALLDERWLSMPKGRLCPWGWSPAVYRLFGKVIPACCDDFRQSPVAFWQPAHKKLYSRQTAVELLQRLLGKQGDEILPGPTELPVICPSLEQVYLQLGRHRKAVVKSPWSASGRGLLFFPNRDTPKKNEELLSGMLNQQGFVTVEPWFDKVLDLSYQFYSLAGKLTYRGRTIFETDAKGRYLRNWLTDSSAEIDRPLGQFLDTLDGEVAAQLSALLSQSDYATLYEGWIGVDAFIYRSDEGRLKFHPMVEINGRFTMGAVALKMRERLSPGSRGFLQLFYCKNESFASFCRQREKEKPLVMENGLIVEGFLPLTPPLSVHHFGACVEVSAPR